MYQTKEKKETMYRNIVEHGKNLKRVFNLDSQIYVEDCGDDTEIEIIDNKKVIDFLNTFKIILNNPNIKGEFRTNLTDALINKDYGMLDAEDMDYILQTCIFGSCVYG